MGELNERDYLDVLDGARRVVEETDPDRLPLVMLGVVRALVQVEHASYNELNLRAGRTLCVSDTPHLDAAVPRFVPVFERHLGEHPLVVESQRQAQRGRAMDVRKISDFLPRARYQRLALYRDCYRHLDTEFQMVVTVASDPQHTVGIALNRKLVDFAERDRAVLELLRPHLRAAYDGALRRARLRRLFDSGQEERAVEDLRRLPGLTRREARVLFHLVQGKSNPEIARSLANSPRTIHKHVEHVFAKLGVTSRAAAVAHVIRRLERQGPNR